MTKRALMIQPGPYGDIILCAPIAKYYSDLGYEVHWPSRLEFSSTIKKFSYAKHIILNEDILDSDWLRSDVMKIIPHMNKRTGISKDYELIINLADRGPHGTEQKYNENFEECKYRIANIPIDEKHNLVWSRDIDKENELYDIVTPKDSNYAFCHLQTSDTKNIPLPVNLDIPIVKCDIIDGFTIFDWYKVIINADSIYTVESSVHQFMDGIIHKIKTDRKYLISRNSNNRTLSKYWNKKFYY